MNNNEALVNGKETPAISLEKVVIGGDLSKLSSNERLSYYQQLCISTGLNPLSRPFEYIVLNGKLTLYARKDCTEQLRNIYKVSITKLERESIDGIYSVVAYGKTASGREDSSLGAVSIENLKGEAKANAMMKAETKAKRRLTLSICGLAMLDETELESIEGVVREAVQSSELKKLAALSNLPEEQHKTSETPPTIEESIETGKTQFKRAFDHEISKKTEKLLSLVLLPCFTDEERDTICNKRIPNIKTLETVDKLLSWAESIAKKRTKEQAKKDKAAELEKQLEIFAEEAVYADSDQAF